MNYEHILERLLSVNLHGGIKLGLSNCIQLNTALDSPAQKTPTIHVGGTNGKGSVTTKIAAALQASGLRVGLYTSPHIACFRERIRINGKMISENAVFNHLSRIFSLTDQLKIPATFFEITTLMALAYFAEEDVDIAVIEVGLGGRLDATNIIHPILSIITSVSLDHTEILGTTLKDIAWEKAGIIKFKTPVILGPNTPVQEIKAIAASLSAPCFTVEGVFEDFQSENNAIARQALQFLDVSEDDIHHGLEASPPCRCETWLKDKLEKIFPSICLPPALILDVAHNPDGIRHLIATLKQRFFGAGIRFVVGLSANKDISACLTILQATASHIHLVRANSKRAASPGRLNEELQNQGYPLDQISNEASIHAAIHHAVEAAGKNGNEIVVVCGTFFIMAEARAALGILEAQDPSSFNETGNDCIKNG